MLARIQRNILAGIFIVIPIWLTVWVITFLIDLLVEFGSPAVFQLSLLAAPNFPALASLFEAVWFQNTVAVLIVLFGLFALGVVGRAVIGRRLLAVFDAVMDRIPLVQSIYGAARKLVTTVQTRPDGHGRVVLIEFPSPGMKAVGLVTRTFTDPATGEEIAAVYVPTTPNPSSGYVELVPAAHLMPLDWTVNEALTFIISGGAVAPDNIGFSAPVSNPAIGTEPVRVRFQGRNLKRESCSRLGTDSRFTLKTRTALHSGSSSSKAAIRSTSTLCASSSAADPI